MKTNKKLIIIVCLVVIVISSILLIVFINNNKKNNNEINTNEKTEEVDSSQSVLSEEVINDLKNNLGKGTNGDVVSVEQRKNDKGENQYIFTYNDGSTQTITVKDKEGGSGVEDIDPDPQEEQPQEDPQEEDPGQQEEEQPQEPLGTVYERYLNMSKREQYFFFKSFDSQSEFVKWYKAAQEEYSKLHPTIEVGKDQYIDFGE